MHKTHSQHLNADYNKTALATTKHYTQHCSTLLTIQLQSNVQVTLEISVCESFVAIWINSKKKARRMASSGCATSQGDRTPSPRPPVEPDGMTTIDLSPSRCGMLKIYTTKHI